ncbi:hypothetical protein TB2_034669 [Malus domestica]
MAFGGDMISFKISESIETTNVVHSCCAIDKIKKIGPDSSAPSTKDASGTMQDEGIGVEHKAYTATALKVLKLAKSTMGKNVATPSQHIGKPPSPISIPISTNRLLPSLVQVPNQMQGNGEVYIDFWKQNAPIMRDYYSLPFIEPKYEYFKEHAMDSIGE